MMNTQSSDNRLKQNLELGNKYLLEANYDQAVTAFLEAIEIDSKCVDAYIGAAEAYRGLGNIDEAIGILQKGYDTTGSDTIFKLLNELIDNTDIIGDNGDVIDDMNNTETESADEEDYSYFDYIASLYVLGGKPFLEWSEADIMEYFNEYGVPGESDGGDSAEADALSVVAYYDKENAERSIGDILTYDDHTRYSFRVAEGAVLYYVYKDGKTWQFRGFWDNRGIYSMQHPGIYTVEEFLDTFFNSNDTIDAVYEIERETESSIDSATIYFGKNGKRYIYLNYGLNGDDLDVFFHISE